MELRLEQPGVHSKVHDVHRRAFGEHGHTVARLVEALRSDDPASLSLVAVDAGDIVGHVLFSRSLLDAPRRLVEVQVLSPLAVLPGHRRRGIGAALVRHGLEVAEQRGVPLVFLEGNPRYYARFGFARADQRGFRKPSLRIPDDAFQVVTLSRYETWMTGTLVYTDTFWEHDCVGLRDSPT